MVSWISNIYVLNLARQADRKHFILGNLLGQGVPYRNIIFHEAKDCKNYEDAATVKQAAKEDGFAFFRDNYEDHPVDDRKSICITWGMCSILRSIKDSDNISMMILDDILVLRNFRRLQAIFHERFPRPFKEFRMLQLASINDDGNSLASCSWDKGIIVEGLREKCSDFAMVVSPQGAEFLLKEIAKQPWCGFSELFNILSKEDIPHVFSTSIPFVVEAHNSFVSQTPDDRGVVR